MFIDVADYENAKSTGSLDGSSIKSLNDYLGSITKMGEFDHKMDQPFKSFVSQLLDITIIIPFIECATGYDLITGEDLTSFELTMKGVFAVVDCLTLGTAVLAAKPFEVGGMAAVKLAGKTIVITMASDATAYTVGYLSNQAGAPLAITMLLSMGSGIAVTKVAGKYFFKNAAGNLLGECNVPGESVDAIDGIKIIDNMVDEKILLDDYKKIRELSIKNPNTNTNSMTFGKYLKDSNGNPLSSAYTKMAESTGDTYFDLGAKWNEIKKTYKLSDKDMFKLFNEPALDDAVSAGKEIRFSQDPRAYGDCALKDEWEYLKSKYDYEDLIKEGDYWYAIK